MPKLDLGRALRIRGPQGDVARLRGPGFLWVRPAAGGPNDGLDPATANIMVSGNSYLANALYEPWNRTTLAPHDWAALFRPTYAGAVMGMAMGKTLPGYGNATWLGLYQDTEARWNRPEADWPANGDARRDMAGFDALVINEGEVLVSEIGGYAAPYAWNDDGHRCRLVQDLDYMGRFVAEARAAGARIILLGNWAPLIDGADPTTDPAWRSRNGDYERRIHYRHDVLSQEGPCFVIPGHRLMARLNDDVLTGQAPAGVTSHRAYHSINDDGAISRPP